MAAHPAPGSETGTLVNALLAHCGASLSGIGGVARPGIVHRLDKDTSGVMVAAKTDAAHQGLSALFAAHDIERVYVALTRGAPPARSGAIAARLGRSRHDRKKMAVLKPAAARRSPITASRGRSVPTTKPLAARLACRLETGRTHQIRVHLASVGRARARATRYTASGPPAPVVRAAIAAAGLRRQALHAAVLGFRHPITAKALSFRDESAARHDPAGGGAPRRAAGICQQRSILTLLSLTFDATDIYLNDCSGEARAGVRQPADM